MKKLNASKTIQLVIFALLAGIYIAKVLLNQEISRELVSDPTLRTLNFLIWASMGLSFFFIFVDLNLYSVQQKVYTSLKHAVHSDELSMIANRYSCDELITRYSTSVLPADFSCIMLEMANIQEINTQYGRNVGDKAIQDFAVMTRLASTDLCFIGRNGGNKFIALFETGGSAKSRLFMDRLEQSLKDYNADSNNPKITGAYGYSISDELSDKEIHTLITLANRRIRDKNAAPEA